MTHTATPTQQLTYAIEATFKGETGYLVPVGSLFGITPDADEAYRTADERQAEATAALIRSAAASADPWDALTGIRVVTL